MVILRRDVAAAQPESIFFQKNSNLDFLTDYDIFMQEKRESLFNIDKDVEKDINSDEVLKEVVAQEEIILSDSVKSFTSYKEYMKSQLHRDEPEKMLSEEEFYNSNSQIKQEHVTKNGRERRRLTKQGKIFTLVYFIAVAAIALIMLLAYGNFGTVIVNAESSAEKVEPLEEQVLDQEKETNWFDKLIDTFY